VSKKVFIIDDADFMVDMLRVVLRDAGYEVVGTAFNGEEAVESIKVLPSSALPDIVTLDVHMPKMDGMEAVGHIRALIPGVKIVLISSNATMTVVMKAKNIGVDAFVAKPFEPRTVLDAIAKLF
jgi:two-component system chemotaxis response regulator CheY